jgi:flagellar biosynthetic protein FlhB
VAEDFDDKTEDPTPRRRQEARERGQVTKSADMSAAMALLGAMIALNFFGPGILNDLTELTRKMLTFSGTHALAASSTQEVLHMSLYILAKVTVPLCLVFMLAAILVTLAQVGLLFTFEPLTPKLSKINPISGFERIVSMDSLIKLFLNLLKIGIISAVAYLTIKDRLPQIINIAALDHWQLLSFASELMFMLGVRMAIVLLVIAIFDYANSWFQNEKKLKMSKQELKEEMRRMEGDPLVKERRRRVARQLANQRMQYNVPKADVVITNPTELAIALKYDPEKMAAPKVVAKGADYMASRIRQIAIQHGVPIVERKPLAQAMYKTVEIGQEIPPSFYKAIAEILAYVYELTNKPKTAMTKPSAVPSRQTQPERIEP